MSVLIEKVVEDTFGFDYEELINKVVKEALRQEGCNHSIELNVILTNNEEIQCLNNEHRGKDAPTDVLSFPTVDYAQIGDIKTLNDHIPDHEFFNMETEELVLGDIVISIEKLKEQAEDYGHSQERELGFLIAHSMLHLLGYDHTEPEDEDLMIEKQESILNEVGLKR